MRTIGFLIIAVLLAVGQVSAAALKEEIIRKPGKYSLDEASTLSITKQPGGAWSLVVAWRSGDATSSVEPNDCLLTDDSFVFVENPNRIWVFDGVEGCVLLSNADKETGTKYFPGVAMRKAPRKFWETLPQKIRAKYGRKDP